MYKNILVIADQDMDQRAAMQKARAIASDDAIKITVLGFIEPGAGTAEGAVGEKDGALQQAIDAEFSGMSSVSYDVVVTKDIAGYCRDYSKNHDIDLLIKTGHRSESLYHTPLDFQLVREVACPTLITSTQKWRAKRSVLVTIDIESDNKNQVKLNKKVARWAQQWAEMHDCELFVAACLNVSEALTELDIVSKDEVRMKRESKARDAMQAFLADLGIDNASILTEAGVPDRVLPSLANKVKADLVVFGSVGRKGVKGALLGNTAEKTMRKLRTDLAIIHPDK